MPVSIFTVEIVERCIFIVKVLNPDNRNTLVSPLSRLKCTSIFQRTKRTNRRCYPSLGKLLHSPTSSPNSSRIPRRSSIAASSSPMASWASMAGSGRSPLLASLSSLSHAISRLSPRSAIHSRVNLLNRPCPPVSTRFARLSGLPKGSSPKAVSNSAKCSRPRSVRLPNWGIFARRS